MFPLSSTVEILISAFLLASMLSIGMQTGAADLHSILLLNWRFARFDHRKRLAAPDACNGEAQQLGASSRSPIVHTDPGGREIGAQIVRAVRRLEALAVLAGPILPLGDLLVNPCCPATVRLGP